ALSVRFFADNARDLSSYLQNAFRAAQKAVAPEALQLLAQHLGADRDIAAREVEKLLLYAADEPAITEEHVQACVAGAIPPDAFRSAKAVASRDKALTDRLPQYLIAQGEAPNGAFTLAIRPLGNLRDAKQALDSGQPADAVLAKAGKARAPKTVQQEFLTQA